MDPKADVGSERLLGDDQPRKRAAVPTLSMTTKLLYSLPSLGASASGVIVGTTLLTEYNHRHVGVSFIAIVQFLAGLVASYLQLILGYLGDRTTSRMGRRRPYMMFGAPFVCAAVALLYAPTGDNGTFNSVWFAITYPAYIIFQEFVNVPYNALGTELTSDDADRKSLYTWVQFMSIMGLITGTALNAIFSTFITVGVAAIVTLVAFIALVVHVKERKEFVAQAKTALPLIPGVRSCIQNRPWFILMMSGTTLTLLNEIVSMFQYLVQYQFHMKVKSGMVLLMAVYVVSQLVFTPIVLALIKRIGKLVTWKIGACFIVVYGVSGFFLSAASYYAYGATIAIFACGLVCCNVTFNIFVSDTIDYDELLTGKRRESTYHSIGNLPSMFFSTAGKAMPLIVLSATGFVTDAKTQTPQVVLAIRAMVTLFPAAVLLTAFVLFRMYTLDEDKHAKVMKGLDAISNGDTAIDPFTHRPVVRETTLAKRSSREVGNPAQQVDANTFLLYFTPNDVRMLASRWQKRVVAKFIGASLFWGLDTGIAIWASVAFLLKGHQQVAFVGLTLGALFSIGLAYELSRLKGMRWMLGLSKRELVTLARAYMKRRQASAVQMRPSGSSSAELGLGQDPAADNDDDSQPLPTTSHMMAKAIFRFSVIHVFCLSLCVGTLLVALGVVHV